MKYWLGSGEALIVIGLCWLLMRHGSHLPSAAHPWLHRLIILGMYAAGTVLVATTVGQWVLHEILRLAGVTNVSTAPGSGVGWAMVTIGGIALIAALAVSLVWAPSLALAYVAVMAPLVLALAPGGIAHQVYAMTSAPAASAVSQVATWAGG